MGEHGAHVLERRARPGEQAVADREHALADDPHAGRVVHERVDGLVDRALERVLDRRQRTVDLAVGDRHDDPVDGRQRDELGVRGQARVGAQRLLAERPRGAEVADAHQASPSAASGTSPASAARTASCSSGESGTAETPSCTCLT